MRNLEFVRIDWTLRKPLAAFLRGLDKSGDGRHFHPHPLNTLGALEATDWTNLDLYYAATCGGRILAYGMLRGWNEGFKVPSLGIAVDQSARGTSLARAFMYFLHMAAKQRGAERIRLKVYPENVKAVKLYESLGYEWKKTEKGQLVGYLKLKGRKFKRKGSK